jgi:polyphosphate kinase 2 (PPK2 family)
LVVFQGMDASGKDGAFKNVFQFSPHAAMTYKSYGKPTAEEFAHDFLWRIHKNAPAKGTISASIRSHYEDILIQKVHNWIDNKRVAIRMTAINAYETLLQEDNNTVVLKFFTHISPERQLDKLAERIEKVEKNWKHKDGDWQEHMQWDKYMEAYEYAINKSTIPWKIVPSDERWYRDYIVAEKVYKELVKMKLEYVKLPPDSVAHEILKTYKATLPKSDAEANNSKKVVNLVDTKEAKSANKSKKVNKAKTNSKLKVTKEKEAKVGKEKSEVKKARKVKPASNKSKKTEEKSLKKVERAVITETLAPAKRGRKPKESRSATATIAKTAVKKAAKSAPAKRGRKPKDASITNVPGKMPAYVKQVKNAKTVTPAKRGRKSKAMRETIITTPPAKRGRKPKAISETITPTPPAKRGRKPTGNNQIVTKLPEKRGRKPKIETKTLEQIATKRGRKPSTTISTSSTSILVKRGRKPGSTKTAIEVAPAKRGRKPNKL